MRKIDAATGATIEASLTISLPGESLVRGGNGLARHPLTNVLYALIRVPSTPFRVLVTLDESTGVATRVGPTGDTGDNFAGLAFADDGTLYAITGDGALSLPPETLCTLSLVDASPTCFLPLGNGSDGEAIGHSDSDDLLFHASGLGTPNDPAGEILEKVDPATGAIAPIPLSGYDYQELTALLDTPSGLLAADLGSATSDDPHLLRISGTGNATLIGSLDHVSRGLARQAVAVPSLSRPGAAVLALLLAWIPGRLCRPRER